MMPFPAVVFCASATEATARDSAARHSKRDILLLREAAAAARRNECRPLHRLCTR